MPNNYSDLINHPRHVSRKHPPMSRDARAAQFAPYAALVGHKEIITQNENLATEQNDIDCDINIISNDESQCFPPTYDNI